MARWLRAAHFKNLLAATQSAKQLEVLFAGRRNFTVYRFVCPGPDGDNTLFVAGLARDLDEVSPHIEAQTRQLLGKGGVLTRVPDIIREQLFTDAAQLVREPITDFQSAFFVSDRDTVRKSEGSVAETSHARCRDCGQSRHKFAR